MIEFLAKIFDTSDFPARWNCGLWTPGHGWLHIASDLATWGAYTAIPIVLAYFLLQRKDIVFPRIFWLFGAFIFACGTVHLVEASIFWWPAYRLSGAIKLGTAVVSWATVIALVRIVPAALTLPGLATINERLENEIAERRSAEKQLRATIEAAPTGMISVDESGQIVLANRRISEMFGYEHDELVGQPVEVLVPGRFRSHHPDLRKSFQGSPRSRPMGEGRDLFARHKDGSEFPVEIGLNPCPSGSFQHVLASIVDISQRKRDEETLENYAGELERSNTELDRFAYVASHDLKAPLRGIDNLAQWIEEDIGETLPEASRKHLSQLKTRVHRMNSLLDDLLHYSRAGRVTGELEFVDTRALVEGIVELLAPPEGFRIRISDQLPSITTYRIPLEQCLRNLINNAIKHHDRPDGTITIRGEFHGGETVFVVEDDGPGIEPEFHERIFEMFQTLNPRDEREGSGMGLAIVKKIVDFHGGRIGVESAPGSGARIRFTWPARKPK